MQLIEQKFWAGTSASYWTAIEAEERVTEFLAGHPEARNGNMKQMIDDMVGPLLSVEGSVGIINVKGSLIQGSAGFMRLFGVTGYDDIRDAFTEAVADRNIKSIVMNVASGGGMVAGVQETGDYIREVDKVKPVYAHSSSMMASAAYWLGVSARKVYASSTAIVGSIGVLQIHQEISQMMEKEGVKTTVIRSGKYKALANRYEPLSDLAKEEMQSQVDDLDGEFIGYVAAQRGVTAEVAKRKMGQGREFLGARAQEAGLVDQILTLSAVHGKMEASTVSNAKNSTKPVASTESPHHNALNDHEGTPMKVNLTPSQLAMLASGTPIENLGLSTEEVAAFKAAKDEADTAARTKAEAEAAAALAAAGTTPPKGDEVGINFLRTELRDTQTTLATANSKLEAANAELVKVKADQGALLKIARASIGTMQVALGGRNTADTLTDTEVLAEHTRLAESFATKFPTGRVSAVSAETANAAEAAKVDPVFAAALQLNKSNF